MASWRAGIALLMVVLALCALNPVSAQAQKWGITSSRSKVIYNYRPQTLNWHQARAYCQREGGELASPTNWAQITLIQHMVVSIRHSTWIGLNDLHVEGHWRTASGGRLRTTYWAPHEPNNAHNEDCAMVWPNRAGRWNDLRCNARLPFICQYLVPI